jgi:glycogen debranching enzyme
VACSGETAVAIASSDLTATIKCREHRFELDFDATSGKVIDVAVGFAFDGAENAIGEVNRLLADPEGHFRSNRKFWEGFFAPMPVLSDRYRKRLSWASWCSMANVIESKYIRFNPAMVHHRAGCYCRVFSWDPLFAFVGLSMTGAKDLARDLLTTYMRFNITPEGRSFMGFSLNGVCDADAEFDFGFDFEKKTERLDNDLQPLYPWVVLEMKRNMNDGSLLDENVDGASVYEKLLLYMNHVERDQEDAKDGLLVRDNAYEGGWDNRKSPLFERGVNDKLLNIQMFYQMSLESMSEICRTKGDHELALKYSGKAETTRKSIVDKMWCEEHGCYEDIDVDGNLAHVLCLDTFFPLRFEKDEARKKKILAHLHNKEEFDLPAGLPTLPANDPDFSLDWGWRGNLWLAQVALVSLCLADGGLVDEAVELMRKHLDRYDMATNVGEHQNPYTGAPNGLGAGPFNWLGLFPVAATHIKNAGGSL